METQKKNAILCKRETEGLEIAVAQVNPRP